MKKTFLIALTILGAGLTAAKADLAFSISFGGCASRPYAPAVVYTPPVVYAPAPVVVAPAPAVCYTPAPVYSAPVYYSQPVYYSAPVYTRPYVVTSFGYRSGCGPSYGHGHWRRW